MGDFAGFGRPVRSLDSFVRELVQRLRFFRSFDPLPPDGRLLARPRRKQTLVKQLRPYLSDVAAAVGISTRIVPHQRPHLARIPNRPAIAFRTASGSIIGRLAPRA